MHSTRTIWDCIYHFQAGLQRTIDLLEILHLLLLLEPFLLVMLLLEQMLVVEILLLRTLQAELLQELLMLELQCLL